MSEFDSRASGKGYVDPSFRTADVDYKNSWLTYLNIVCFIFNTSMNFAPNDLSNCIFSHGFLPNHFHPF